MAAPMCHFPVRTKQTFAEIGSNFTNIVCSSYEDYVFLIVTQNQKLGSLVHVWRDAVLNFTEGNEIPTYSTKVLLGKDEPMLHILAKNVVISMNTVQSVLVAISLKDTSLSTVKQICELVQQCKVWTQ